MIVQMMLMKIMILALPLIEIALFIGVGMMIGILPTLLLIVATTVVGLFIMRQQGWRLLSKTSQRMQMGQVPTQSSMSTVMLMFSAMLMVLPGFLTDVVGLIGLLPFVRHWLIGKLTKQGMWQRGPGHHMRGPRVIEGEFTRQDAANDPDEDSDSGKDK